MSIKPKSRLGRGLSSLIAVSELPVSAEAPDSSTAPPLDEPKLDPQHHGTPARPVYDIPIESIVPNPHQPRKQMNERALAELAESLKSSGLIQPIVVRATGNKYELVAGERRWRAAALAGLESIPAIVREVNALEQAQLALVENIHRENLNPIDRALAYRTLCTQLGLTQAELATRLGEDRSTLANYLRLLDLPEAVQAMVVAGQLSHGHAKLIAGVVDILEQERLAKLVVAQELSVRNLEKVIGELQQQTPATPQATPAPASTAHIHDLEKRLSRQLGLRVQVRTGAKNRSRGKLILHYANLDQFDDIIQRLGVEAE